MGISNVIKVFCDTVLHNSPLKSKFVPNLEWVVTGSGSLVAALCDVDSVGAVQVVVGQEQEDGRPHPLVLHRSNCDGCGLNCWWVVIEF